MLEDESTVRLGFFFGILLTVAVAEVLRPRRPPPSRERWVSNFGIVLTDTVLTRLVLPAGVVGAALYAQRHQLGVFNLVSLPAWVEATAAFLLLDLAIYFQHRAFHAVPILWRMHRVHHSDLDFDFTTALRFHPFEILLSTLIKMALVAALGAPLLAVVAFEIVLSGAAMFNHSNVSIPPALERVLRLFIVTPDMHRVHHSIERRETDSNFGFNAPWWDRLFGTYLAQPRRGHGAMTIGIERFRDAADQRFDRLLLQPFR